jgi:amino acid transporter
MAGIAIVALFVGLNLRGVGDAGSVEVFLVWFKLIILVGLAGWGLTQWDPLMLLQGVPDAGISAALFDAAHCQTRGSTDRCKGRGSHWSGKPLWCLLMKDRIETSVSSIVGVEKKGYHTRFDKPTGNLA